MLICHLYLSLGEVVQTSCTFLNCVAWYLIESFFIFKDGGGREKERERNIYVREKH